MYRKKIISLLLVTSLCNCLMACSPKETASDTTEKISSEEELLVAAFDNFNSENLRGTNTVYTTTYEDGSEIIETETLYYDAEKGIIEKQYLSEGNESHTFLAEEKDHIYCYEKDDSYPDGWVRYLEQPDDTGETMFDYLLAEFTHSFDEESGYENVIIKNEGTENLNGIETVKIKVNASFAPIHEDDSETSLSDTKKITRQDIIEEFGWSEESVNAVKGFSEILDNYVAFSNDTGIYTDDRENDAEEFIFWIDTSKKMIVQLHSSFVLEAEDTAVTEKAEEEFWANCWKVDWIQTDLNDGIPLEQALEIYELEAGEAEAHMEYEQELSDESLDASDDLGATVVYVKTFLTGKSCPSLSELPDKYTETTREDYNNVFNE